MRYTIWKTKEGRLVVVREDGECFNLVPTKDSLLDKYGAPQQGSVLVSEFAIRES